jgi:hypothetical protein
MAHQNEGVQTQATFVGIAVAPIVQQLPITIIGQVTYILTCILTCRWVQLRQLLALRLSYVLLCGQRLWQRHERTDTRHDIVLLDMP